jgi:SAM-dependent methyltransferase
MLSIAAHKLGGEKRTSLILSPAERLPFPDNTFDVVTCLEALEFMTNPDAVLAEIVRVLRPGGLLFTSNRINTRLMPGKTRSDDALRARLEALGMAHIVIEYWQVDYNRVWARKAGTSMPTLARPLAEILRCPKCQQALLTEQDGGWRCPKCRYQTKASEDGVIPLVAP